MTQRPRRTTRPATTPPQRFALHPLGLAALLAVAAPGVLALPQGATVVNGQVTIQNPSATQQLITQGTNKAIIDWRSFSIGAGEKVRFDQPSSTAVLLNRVTGYEPTAILGQMQANGRIFLLNPQGVLFGANARIDVGGMVASTLSLSNSDFLASNYRLASAAGVALGEVRNEGTISAPGGTVVLAGPSVTNTGSIEADRGRVGLAAANNVLVDVEGDGLVLFQTSATEANNRLAQLGRIRADGGSVELRAAARGSFADTVLNMSGIVQAKSLGTKNGRVVIDGGSEGITAVSGQVDASGVQAGQSGGDITVAGQKVLLAEASKLDVSGDAGGGRIRVGGGWQGGDADVRNAEAVSVRAGAQLGADAITNGNAGQVVVWSDKTTRFAGAVSAQGGSLGGDGGNVEISGKQTLTLSGSVALGAANGKRGTLLLDPTSITVANLPATATQVTDIDEFSDPGGALSIQPITLVGFGGNIVLQANQNITITDGFTLPGGATFTAQAGGSIFVNAAIATTNQAISLRANDPGGTTGLNGLVSTSSAGSINAGTSSVTISNAGSSATNSIGANITGNAGITITGATQFTGTPTLANGGGGGTGIQINGAITGGTGDLTLSSAAAKVLASTANLASLTSSGAGATTLNGNVTTSGTQTYGATTLGTDATLAGSAVTITNLNAANHAFGVNADALTISGTTSNLAAVSVAPSADGVTTGLAGGAGTLALSQALIDKLNGTSLTLGRAGSTVAITSGATLTLPTDTTITNGSGAVTLGNVTGGTHALTVTGSGTTTIGAGTSGITTLVADGGGTTSLSGTITTTVAQNFAADTVTLGANTTLVSPAVTLGAVTGAGNDLTVTSAATTLSGNVSGTGAQTYGAVTLGNTVSLSGTTLTLGNVTGGANGLTVTPGTSASLATVNAASLTANGAGTTTLNGNVTTTGAQSYATLALGANAQLTGTNITLGGATTGAFDLTLTASGTAAVNAAVGTATLTSDGSGTTSLAANVTTTAAQVYNATTLGAAATLSGSSVSFASLDGANRALTLSTDALAITGATSNLAAVTIAPTTAATTIGLAGGAGTLALDQTLLGKLTGTSLTIGRADSTAAITGAALTLGANTTLLNNTAAVTLGAVTGAGHALTVTTSGTTTLSGGTSGITTLTANGGGATSLSGSIAASALQNFAGEAITLTGNTTLTAPSVVLGAVTAGANDLTVSAASTTLNGNVSGTGAQAYGALALGANVTLSGSDITIGGAVSGVGRDFTVTPTSTAAINGAVTAANVTANGAGVTTLGGNVTTTGNQSYAAAALSAPATLRGAAIALNGAFNAGANDLALETLALTVPGSLTGTAGLRLAGFNAGDTIGLASATVTDLTVSQTALNNFTGFSSFAVGRSDGTGAIFVGDVAGLSLPLNLTILGASAPVTLGGAVTGNNHSLAITTGGATAVNAALAGLSTFSATGPVTLGANVTTSGTQNYGGAVTLGANSTLTGSAVTLGAVTGAGNDLTVAAATTTLNGNVSGTGAQSYGAVTLGNSVTLSGTTVSAGNVTGGANSLTVTAGTSAALATVNAAALTANGASTTTLNGNVTTTGAQSYGAVALGGSTTLAGTSVVLGSVNGGANGLVLNASTGASLGTATNLASVAATGAGATTLNGNVTTSGTQSYGAVTLGSAATLTGTNVSLGNVSGANVLTVTASGTAAFGGTVGASGLVSNGAGTTTLAGNVTTSGNQAYNATTLLGPITLQTGAGNGVTFNSTLDAGGQALNLTADALTLSGAASNLAAVTVQPTGDAVTVGLAGGAGTLSLAQATLDKITGVGSSLTIGRTTSTATMTAGATLALATDTTLRNGSGDVALSAITGNGHALSVTTSGASSFGSTTSGLSTLTANGGGTTSLSGTITTSGAQTYTDAVALTGATTLQGTTVSLAGGVSGAQDLTVTAANGVSFGNLSGLNSLTSNGAGATTLNGNITTVTTQNYGAVVLGTDATLAGTTLTLGGPVSGAHNLTLTASTGSALGSVSGVTSVTANGAGATTLNGNVATTGTQTYAGVVLGTDVTVTGTTLNLAGPVTGAHNLIFAATTGTSLGTVNGVTSLLASGAGATTLNGNVTTTGAQNYGALVLGTDSTLTGTTLGIGGAVTGAHALAVTPSTSASFASTVDTSSLTTNGTGTTSLAGNVSTTGAQTYSNVTLAAPVVLTSPTINMTGAFAAGANDLALQTSALSTSGSLTGSANLRIAGLLASNTIGLEGDLGTNVSLTQAALNSFSGFGSFTLGRPDGTGAISVATTGAVTLPINLTVTGASAPVTFGSLGVNGNGHALAVTSATGLTTVNGTLSNLSTFAVTGATSLAGSVTSAGTQTYGGTVTLTGASALTGTALNFNAGGSSLNAGASSIALNTRDVTFAGTVTSTGAATLAGFTVADTLGIATATPTAASFSAAEIAKFGAAGTLTLGRADSTGAVSVGALTLPRDTTIVANNAPINVEAAITGANHALAISSSGATTLATAPTGLASLNITGPVTLPGGTISTSGAQSYGNTVTLAANQTLDASSINFGGALNVGTRDLTLQYDIALTGPTSASGTGFVSLAPRTVGSTIGVAGGAGTFQVSQATLNSLTAFPNLGVGRADGTGLISVGALTLPANFRLQSGSGDIQFASGTAGGANALNVTTGGTTTLAGAFSNLSSLSVGGATALSGAVTVGASGNVAFGSTINGPGSLAIASAGATTIAGAVGNTSAVAGLSSDAAGTLSLGGSITSTGAITLADPLTLSAASTTLAGTTVDLQAVNGTSANTQALIVNASTGSALRGAVGATVPLASLAVSGGTTQLGANVTTGGTQSFAAPVLLIGDATLAASAASFGSTIDGAFNLAVNAAGATGFTGNIGATTQLASLTTNAGGTTTLPASVRTTGAQSFGDAVTLVAASTTLNGSAVAFAGTVEGTASGAQALTINANGLTSFGSTVGAAAPLASLTTDVVGTTTLAGSVRATGALSLNDAVTLTGDVVATGSSVLFNTSVDGAHALSVVSSGTTQFSGQVGGITPLTSLTTDATGTTVLTNNVTTSGAQNYGDALQLLGDATLSGSAVSFGSTIDGLRALVVNTSGATSFGGNIGTTAALSSLATNAVGTTLLPARVVTLGTQSYGDDVTLSAATSLSGSGIAFGGNLAAGAFNLTTRSDALSLAGAAGGTGTLTFEQALAAGSIGLGGAPGTLQLDAGLLGKLGTFAGVTIGRADGTAAIGVGTLTLSAPTTLLGATAPVNFSGALDGGGKALTLATTGTTTVAGSLTNLATFAVPNAAVFNGGSVTTSGAQTYGAPVTLAGNATLNGGTLQFGGAVDGPGALTLASTGGTTFNAAVGATTALASLNASGPVQINGGSVRTTGTQTYGGTLGLGSATTLTGTDIAIAGGIDGAQLLNVLASGTATFGGAVGATTPLTGVTTSNAVVLAGNVTTTGAQSYAGAVLLTGDATLAGTSVTFGGALDGAHALATNSAGTTTFVGAVGAATPLTSVTIAGPTQIDGGTVTTSGAQSFGGAVGLGSATALTGSTLSFGSTLDGPGALTLQASGTASFGAAIGGATPLAALAVNAAGGSTLNGNITTTGAQSWSGPVLLGADVTASGASLGFAGAIDGAHALQLNAAGATVLGAPVGSTTALASLATDAAGTTSLAGNVRTTGAQNYLDAVTLTGAATLAGNAVTFGSTLDGAVALTVNATNTRFGANVGGVTALTSLSTDAAGTTRIGGNVRTTGAQTYADALQLDADATLAASTLTLGSTLDGAHALTATVAGNTTLNGAIGATTALTSVAVSGTTTQNAGSVTTTGSQTYTGAVTLARATTLSANGLSFGTALDGAQALTIQNAGATSFGAAVGATTALASLTTSGGGTVSLAGASIDTSGAQSYSGALQLAGSTRLTGSSLAFGGNVSGAQDLQLVADALSTAGGVAGTGVLSITPRSAATSIGIAGGTGALQVSQALITSAGGFTQHVIGRTDGTGAIEAGSLTLGANTILQTGSGNLTLGATNGAFDLALTSAGTTRLTGAIGTTTALRSLATDAPGSTVFDDASGSAQIVTSGAQTYADPVSATIPVRFSGGAITATQASNHVAGKISGSVDTLNYADSGDVQLGDLSLANGGSIVAAGTIKVDGALNLGGGTLSLRSNATPVAETDFSDPDLKGKALTFGGSLLKEASATIFQTDTSSVTSAAGSLLVLRTPGNGSLLFDSASNKLLGNVSAVAGTLGDNDTTRFGSTATATISLVRINSSEIHVAGAPPTDGNQGLLRAGIEGDAVKLTADKLTTGADGLIRARLPFDNLQGSQTSLPGLTLVMSPQALLIGGGFGTADAATWIQVRVGNNLGGFLTVRPKGANGDTAVILLAGADPKPFYDGAGKLTEVRVFYNGDTPRTPQESGALNAVIALVEEARHARFEEAVRTENVSSRLRSGVIAEVGSGRPATVGRESIRMPETCNVKADSLKCE